MVWGRVERKWRVEVVVVELEEEEWIGVVGFTVVDAVVDDEEGKERGRCGPRALIRVSMV